MISKKPYSSLTPQAIKTLKAQRRLEKATEGMKTGKDAYSAPALTPTIIRKRTNTVEAFEAKVEAKAPDFAELLTNIYSLTAKMVTHLQQQDEYSSKDINALTALTKALPTLQEAEKNHKTKLAEKEVEDLSAAELMELAKVIVSADNPNSPFSTESRLLQPPPNNIPENESGSEISDIVDELSDTDDSD